MIKKSNTTANLYLYFIYYYKTITINYSINHLTNSYFKLFYMTNNILYHSRYCKNIFTWITHLK